MPMFDVKALAFRGTQSHMIRSDKSHRIVTSSTRSYENCM